MTITSNVTTNASSSTGNGSGGVIAVADVDSDISGTDNNSAFVGADFGSAIAGDSATPQVDGTGITIKAGGNIKIAATTFLTTSISADTDSGGGFDVEQRERARPTSPTTRPLRSARTRTSRARRSR